MEWNGMILENEDRDIHFYRYGEIVLDISPKKWICIFAYIPVDMYMKSVTEL